VYCPGACAEAAPAYGLQELNILPTANSHLLRMVLKCSNGRGCCRCAPFETSAAAAVAAAAGAAAAAAAAAGAAAAAAAAAGATRHESSAAAACRGPAAAPWPWPAPAGSRAAQLAGGRLRGEETPAAAHGATAGPALIRIYRPAGCGSKVGV
jgi:hypothetical protein